jgi:hypothetical protein
MEFDEETISIQQEEEQRPIAEAQVVGDRTGWVHQDALLPHIESVADHSWRVSQMAMVGAFASEWPYTR